MPPVKKSPLSSYNGSFTYCFRIVSGLFICLFSGLLNEGGTLAGADVVVFFIAVDVIFTLN